MSKILKFWTKLTNQIKRIENNKNTPKELIDNTDSSKIIPTPSHNLGWWGEGGVGEGGITVKNKGDQEFSNLTSMICMNVQSEVLHTFDVPVLS